MAFTEQLTQALAVVGHKAPAALTSGTTFVSSPVDMSVFRRVITYMDFAGFATGTVTLFYAAANNVAFTTAGTQAGGVTNSTTWLSATALVTINSVAATRVESLEMRADQLPAGYRWVEPVFLLDTTATCTVGVIVLAGECAYKPGQQFEGTAYAAGTTGSAIRDQAVVC